ncbi:unnamed protein product [Didymodactylos carnosus]|uniref:NAD(P)(+)--arginine ADP-ribosyltransferase n=1 Tax=Didymodactylos carnosus TaxID=1234261 RepID=A0A8S2HY33_9BILA|nr:unnamed protein product [Didymodactylos carnosus]CAF3698438.1 unnamed protein product [Didymodactylos carnosus]
MATSVTRLKKIELSDTVTVDDSFADDWTISKKPRTGEHDTQSLSSRLTSDLWDISSAATTTDCVLNPFKNKVFPMAVINWTRNVNSQQKSQYLSNADLKKNVKKPRRGGIYLQGSIRRNYPTIEFDDIKMCLRGCHCSLALYLLTECFENKTYFIHNSKGIFLDSKPAIVSSDENEFNKNGKKWLRNPHLVELTEEDVQSGKYVIKQKVFHRSGMKECGLKKFCVRNPLTKLWIRSNDRVEESASDLDLNLSNFHLGCILLRNDKTHVADLWLRLGLDPTVFENTNDFEDRYTPDHVIDFFQTRSTAFFGINESIKDSLNDALRNEHIPTICAFWFLIHDLFNQLLGPSLKHPTPVFHGQYMTGDELFMLETNIGAFISFKTFFSTSTSSVCALRHVGNGQRLPDLEAVLFEIKFNESNTRKRFAKTVWGQQADILLFSPATIFRLDSVEKLNEQLWHCTLSISGEYEDKVGEICKDFENEIGVPVTFLSLGIYLSELGQGKKAANYYETLLMITTSSETKTAIHNNLAIVYEQLKDFHRASQHLLKARETDNTEDKEMFTVP